MKKIPLVTKSLKKRLVTIMVMSGAFVIYISTSSVMPWSLLRLSLDSRDRAILIIGFLFIWSISLSGILLSEKLNPSLIDFLQKNQFLNLGNATLLNEDQEDESHYLSSVFLGLQKELAQVNLHTKTLADANKSLAMLAVKDSLSGLYNQYYIKERLSQELYRTERYQRTLSVLMLDLDDFKKINDRYGHLVGDSVIKTFGRLIKATIRPSDIPGRYGGEEFLILLPETSPDNAQVVAERIREKTGLFRFRSTSPEEPEFHITVSIGICAHPQFGHSPEDLIGLADIAMYRAKELGKNRVVIYSEQKHDGARHLN